MDNPEPQTELNAQTARPCQDKLYACTCVLSYGHKGDHACDCGGEWDTEGNPVTFPIHEGIYTAAAIIAMRREKA